MELVKSVTPPAVTKLDSAPGSQSLSNPTRLVTNALDDDLAPSRKLVIDGVRPLVDVDDSTRWWTLAPRYGEFSVDSVKWWQEMWREPFHAIVELPWWLVLLGYLGTYTTFIFTTALALFLIGKGNAASLTPDVSWASCVACAWQTVTTVGYGGASTAGVWANAVGALAVVLSLMFDAIGIGLIYQKVSSPSRKSRRCILHSTRACVCRAQPGMPMRFECRVHHLSDYALVDPSVKLYMARFHSGQQGEGRVAIEFQELRIGNRTGGQDTPFSAFMQYPWSVLHFIDESSPLAPYVLPPRDGSGGLPEVSDDFGHDHVEIICKVLGTAPSTGNTCESRHSYTAHNIEFGHRFADALRHHPSDGTLCVDLAQFSRTVLEDPTDLVKPQCF